jgi:hypothetical protein
VDYRIPDAFRANTPERLRAHLAPLKARGLFPDFPFGHDFTPEELKLGKALKRLQAQSGTLAGTLGLMLSLLRAPPPQAQACLERMALAAPKGFKERLLARLVGAALKDSGAV